MSLPMPRLHQSLRYTLFRRLFARVDHGVANKFRGRIGGGQFHDICTWRNGRQRDLAGRYATAMGCMRTQR